MRNFSQLIVLFEKQRGDSQNNWKNIYKIKKSGIKEKLKI